MTTSTLDRRTFLHATAAAAGSLVAVATSDIGPALGDAAAVASDKTRNTTMTYTIKPLPFDPQRIKGLSEKILLSHYENNYGGAVKRLNAITEQLASLDYEKAPRSTPLRLAQCWRSVWALCRRGSGGGSCSRLVSSPRIPC